MVAWWEFPRYEDDGSEAISFENLWRGDFEQEMEGTDCFVPSVFLAPTGNKLVLELTADEFTEIFSALYNGAEFTYPEKYLQVIANFLKGLHCSPDIEDEGGCINFKPYASFIEYEPANPFNEPDLIPEGYINQPFHFNSDFAYPELLGFQSTDVLVPLDAIPVFGDWGDVLGLHFPTIKLHVVGTGQIEVDFLAITAGGQVIVKVGSPPNILDLVDGIIETGVKIIDLGQDITAIPPESDLVIAEEIPIDAPEGTDVYFVFVPKIDVSTDFFGMGGGIRQIGLCGLETDGSTMGIEDMRWSYGGEEGDLFRPPILQKRVSGVWETIELGDDIGAFMLDSYRLALDAWGFAYAIRNLEEFPSYWSGDEQGWPTSPLKAYIDALDDAALMAANSAVETANSAADNAALALASAATAQATANGAVTVNGEQNVDIAALQAGNIAQGISIDNLQDDMTTAQTDITNINLDVALLQAWQAIATLSIEAHSQFQSDMPQPFGVTYDFATDGLPANWDLVRGTAGLGGLFSENISGQQYILLNQILFGTGGNPEYGQGNVYGVRIAVQWTGATGEIIKAGMFGVNPPDTVVLNRPTDAEFDIYLWRFLGTDFSNFGIEVHNDENFPFKVRALTVFGWGFPNSV